MYLFIHGNKQTLPTGQRCEGQHEALTSLGDPWGWGEMGRNHVPHHTCQTEVQEPYKASLMGRKLLGSRAGESASEEQDLRDSQGRVTGMRRKHVGIFQK